MFLLFLSCTPPLESATADAAVAAPDLSADEVLYDTDAWPSLPALPSPPEADAPPRSVALEQHLPANSRLVARLPELANALIAEVGGQRPGLTVTTELGGTLKVSADGTYRYVPPANFAGVDGVDLVLRNTAGVSVGRLDLIVGEPPEVQDDVYPLEGQVERPATAGLLANDTPAHGVVLSVMGEPTLRATTEAGGQVIVAPDGSFVYTAPDGVDSDAFTYAVGNGHGTVTARVVLEG